MRKKRSVKILSMALAAALVVGVGASLSSCTSETKDDLGIAIVTAAAGQNDNGYNQSAVDGAKKAKDELGINYKVVDKSADIPGSLKLLAEEGYKLIFTLEYNFDDLINGTGGNKPIAEQYPDTTFVVFNDNPNVNEDGSVKHKNVISVMFNVHEASFMAGALATLVNENAAVLFDSANYNFSQNDQGGAMGFIGGTASNGITVFSYGFAEGVNYIANSLNKKYTYYSDYNAGFTDSAAGGAKANTYYSAGANVVFSVAGSVGDGVTAKAKEVKKLAIEVDANKDNNQPGYVLTSVLKNTEVPVFEIAKNFKEGKMSEINGKVLSYDLASGATGITDLSVIEKNITESGKAKWEEIKTQLKDIQGKIASGEIKVTNAQAGDTFDKTKLTNLDMPND